MFEMKNDNYFFVNKLWSNENKLTNVYDIHCF